MLTPRIFKSEHDAQADLSTHTFENFPKVLSVQQESDGKTYLYAEVLVIPGMSANYEMRIKNVSTESDIPAGGKYVATVQTQSGARHLYWLLT